METTLYIGQNKVVKYNQDKATGLAAYQLEDGSYGDCTIEQFTMMASPEPYGDGRIAVRKWKPTLKKILQILREDNLRILEKSFVLQQLELSIDDVFDRAVSKLMNVDFKEEVTLQQLNEIVAPDETPKRTPPVIKTETKTEEASVETSQEEKPKEETTESEKTE